MHTLTFTKHQFSILLEDFEMRVKTGLVEKLPYSAWRALKHIANLADLYDDITIKLTPDAKIYYLCELYLNEEWITNVHISRDSSFVVNFLFNLVHCDCEKLDNKNNINMKENDKTMKFNFDFGTCKNDNVKLSIYGIAVKNATGTYVSYNPETKEIIDVDILNFDGGEFLFKMPVAIKDIAVGDVIIHNRVPIFVTEVSEAGDIFGIDVAAGEKKNILPTKSPFGLNFVTKVVSVMNAFNAAPTPDAPFGNMLPFFMMGENNTIDPMVMMMMASGGKMDFTSNPMMLYFLMKDKDKNGDNMLPLMFMMNQNK